MLTLEEAAETFRRLLPLGMSAHQALNLMNPVGKALAQKEDEVVKALFEEAGKKGADHATQRSTHDAPTTCRAHSCIVTTSTSRACRADRGASQIPKRKPSLRPW